MTMFSTARQWDGLSRSAVFRSIFNSRKWTYILMTEKGQNYTTIIEWDMEHSYDFFVYGKT